MIRLLIMCLLGLSGVFFGTCGIRASAVNGPSMETVFTTNDAEEMSAKSKRHHLHPAGTPCPQQSHSHSGAYLPPVGLSAYQKPLVIPSYQHVPKVESIGYQKPVIPKMIYQTIQRPAIHHAAYNIQPNIKPQVHYLHQPSYMPIVKELPISYNKPAAVVPPVSYENVQKLFTNFVKPVQHIQPVQTIYPVKSYVKEIPCEKNLAPAPVVEKAIEKPVVNMHSYYAKQFFQPISYYPKPMSEPKPITLFSPHVSKFHYPTTKVIYEKPNLISQHQGSAIKISSGLEPACEKMHQPQISYVKIPQPIIQNVHQPMFQYAPKYHQPAVVQQPMIHFAQKIEHPIVQQPLFHFAPKIHQPAIVQQPLVHFSPKIHQPNEQNTVVHYQHPIVYGNAQHSAAAITPQVNYHGHNFQSPIVNVNQPCHK